MGRFFDTEDVINLDFRVLVSDMPILIARKRLWFLCTDVIVVKDNLVWVENIPPIRPRADTKCVLFTVEIKVWIIRHLSYPLRLRKNEVSTYGKPGLWFLESLPVGYNFWYVPYLGKVIEPLAVHTEWCVLMCNFKLIIIHSTDGGIGGKNRLLGVSLTLFKHHLASCVPVLYESVMSINLHVQFLVCKKGLNLGARPTAPLGILVEDVDDLDQRVANVSAFESFHLFDRVLVDNSEYKTFRMISLLNHVVDSIV